MPGAPWGWGVNARKREREKEGSEKASKQAAKGNLAPVDHGNPLKLTCTGAGSNANTPAGLKPLDVCAHDMAHATNGVASHADTRSHDAACTDIEDDTTHDMMHASRTDARSRGYQLCTHVGVSLRSPEVSLRSPEVYIHTYIHTHTYTYTHTYRRPQPGLST